MKFVIRVGLAISVLLVALGGALVAMRKPAVDPPREQPTANNSVADEDKRLQVAAEAALGERDGSIVVLDPRIVTKSYGQKFIQSLPKLPVRDAATVPRARSA